MRTMTLRKSTLALAFGAAMALAMPALAEGGGESSGDAQTNQLDSRMFNNADAYRAQTTTTYTTPGYVAAPQTATTYSTVAPNGTTTTTTTYGPGAAYVPPTVSSTTTITQKPCNPYDVPRPGVTTACPY